MLLKKPQPAWTLSYDRFDLAQEGLRESLCTLGNGYFGTRGAAPESTAGKIHYPGTYIAGVFNKLGTHVSGRVVYNEDFANCPNWLFITFKIGDGKWFDPSTARILFYRQELDMKNGILHRRLRVQDGQGNKTLIKASRIVSMSDHHLGAIRYEVIPENYSSWITVRSMLDGSVLNLGVERYRQLSHKHWKSSALGNFGRNGVYLSMHTSQSKIALAQAAKIRIFHQDKEHKEKEFRPKMRNLIHGKNRIGQEFRLFAWEKQTYTFEKVVSIYTSKDEGVEDPLASATHSLRVAPRFKALYESHSRTWDALWEKFDIKIDGDIYAQRVLRLHTFHLIQTASVHNPIIDAGFPARGLHGEAYRGHIFWDELYAMFFYDLHIPDTAKSLLMYRYRRLSKARDYAKSSGFRGAMFPWQSGSTGEEETQVLHLNPMSGEWGADHSCLQRHVSFAIVYNVIQYWKRTGDFDFMVHYGAEIVLSVSQFASSLTKFSSKTGRYHTQGIMGPDEFHEMLPGSSKPGLKDNSYSNIMIVWCMIQALELLRIVPENHRERLVKKIALSKKEISRWDDITRRMNLIINEDGIIAQFDGYFGLKELDWVGYKKQYGNIHRMDRILKAEGRSPDEYKVAKQADVLMLFYLFPETELRMIFDRLGCKYQKNLMRKNYEYYVKRTSHGSTLSKVVHCMVAQRFNRPKLAWSWFKEVLDSDISDIQGGTTPEGIHCGVMGGSLDVVMRGFAGITLLENIVKIDPNLPEQWNKLKFRFLYERRWFAITLTHQQLTVLIHEPMAKAVAIPVEVNGTVHYIPIGKTVKIELKKKKKGSSKALVKKTKKK